MWCNKIKTLVFDGFSAAPTSFAASTFSQWNSQVNWDGEVYSINYTNDWDSQAALTFAQTKSLPTTGWTAVTT
jgi:hypothetical protein